MIRLFAAACLALGLGTAHAQQTFSGFYPEGPAWIGGALYWAEMQSDTVYRLNGTEKEPFLEERGCGPTAISRYRETDFIVLCHFDASLLHLGPDGKILDRITATADGTRLRNPNDAASDNVGGVWFTDPGRFSAAAKPEGRLYHLSKDGKLTVQAEDLHYGNGVYVDWRQGQLYLSEHLARKVWRFMIDERGLGPRELLVDLNTLDLAKPRYSEAGPDGLELSPDGHLWVAEYGTKRLLGFDAGGKLVAALEVDAPYITNIAFSKDGQAVITGSYTNHEPRNRGGIWLFDSSFLSDAVQAD